MLIIPGMLLALITAHLMVVWHQGHAQWPGKKERERNEVGEPLYPVFMAKTAALFFFVFGILAVFGVIAQINPIWLFGPYNPAISSNTSQPDWYIGFLEGALRLIQRGRPTSPVTPLCGTSSSPGWSWSSRSS